MKIWSDNMTNPPLRRYMRSDATKLSTADYEDIMQYRDMKSKPLKQLRKKFHISSSRLYQIWRGQEVGRVEWGPRNIHKRVRSEFAYNESKKSCRSFLLWIIPAKIIFPNLDNGWNYRNSGPERMRILDHFWTWPLHIYFGVLSNGTIQQSRFPIQVQMI